MCQAEGSESTEPYRFFRQQSGGKASDAQRRKQYRYNTRNAPPSLTSYAKRMAKLQHTASAADKKKNSTFPSSYHHRQRRRKGSGTHALANLREDVSAVAALIIYKYV